MIVLIAAGCLLTSVALWKSAFDFTIDAAPVGSIMLAASVLLFAMSLFLFGMAIGEVQQCG